MNITEALNAALPDIPARTFVKRYPRVDPGITLKEHVEQGERIVRVYVPSAEAMYKFPAHNWALAKLFDGKRSYEEITAIFSAQTGAQYSCEAIREFADDLESVDFWYRTPQEKNILLMQKSSEERHKLLKAKKDPGDLSLYAFPAVNPDKFLTWLVRHTEWIYTWWFTMLTLMAFAFTGWITITHWSEIGRDTLEFYNFSDKSWWDFIEFYLLATVVLGFHEIGHGHACKHYGGRVPAMGFALIYLAPAFYTDTTEGAVQGSRSQRLVIALAGVWAELMICAVATPIWWNTPPDTAVHNAAYVVMLITGISAALINWNPLIKLDGYHMMCEMMGIVDLKEASTAYVSGWVKRHIWGLPVEVPYVPKQRRLGYAIYAILSGLYSYSVLYVVARFVGNIFRNFNPEWSFVPELATAALIFRSRIRLLVNFMKFLYLDKKDRIRAWLTSRRAAGLAFGAAIVFCLPVRHECAEGRFVLQPARRAVIRAVVPGIVTAVNADEGQQVEAGATLIELRDLPLQLSLIHSEADYVVASNRATSAAMRYGNFGTASQERERLAMQTGVLSSEAANQKLRSPIGGAVLTSRAIDRLGSYVTAGTELLEVADLSVMRARIYVSEHDMYKIRVGAGARLQVDGTLKTWDAQAVAISPIASEIDPDLGDHSKYQGLVPPNFYVAEILVANSGGNLKPGMNGTARIYGKKRSAAGFAWQEVKNFIGRKVW
jgi:putative peptide zinc metalloprotease protein